MSKKENPLLNIAFNIIIPVLILNKAPQYLPKISPVTTLLIALGFPFFYGLTSYLREKKINWISVMGLIGVLLTGGFALLQFSGLAFAIKEAAIPFIFGLAAVGSILYKKPFTLLLIKSPFFKTDLIFQKLKEKQNEAHFHNLMNKATLYFSGSFFLSALLNFFIAKSVFQDTESQQILNEQIAKMTWLGYVVIAAPLSVLTILIFWKIISDVKKMTELGLHDIIVKD